MVRKFLRYASLFLLLVMGVALAEAKDLKIKGTVLDSKTGVGIEGVVVSDGMHCVKSDRKGAFMLKSDPEKVRNVFVVTPAEYEVEMNRHGFFGAYAPVDPSSEIVPLTFRLEKRRTPCDHYLMMYLGDPQLMSSRPHSIESIRYDAEHLKAYAQNVTLPLYQTILGDMVTNEIEVKGRAVDFLTMFSKCSVRTFALPGNHDHVQRAKNYKDSIAPYSRYFGPSNYAVNIGKVHYIFLDNCAWGEAKQGRFWRGLNDEAYSFLLEDLKYVDPSTPLMISMHCPMTKSMAGKFYSGDLRYDEMISALKGRNVNFWYGHVHLYANYVYTAEELNSKAPGVKSLESHLVGRCGGAWCCSGEITQDGSPRGGIEVEVDGTEIKWRFRNFDESYPEDFNVYTPGMFPAEVSDPKALYCNVYLWDNMWPVPEFWSEGKKVGEMERVVTHLDATVDPLYATLYPKWESMGMVGFRKEPPTESQCTHLFRIVPPEGTRSGEIRLRDRFGRDIKREIKW